MKRIKFYEDLVPLILSGKKTSTWRLYDDKDLQVGDELEFVVTQTGKVFAKARIIKIRETTLGEITEKDFNGHETYKSREEMFETYKKYYGDKATPDAPLKMIWFKVEEIYENNKAE